MADMPNPKYEETQHALDCRWNPQFPMTRPSGRLHALPETQFLLKTAIWNWVLATMPRKIGGDCLFVGESGNERGAGLAVIDLRRSKYR